MKRLVWVALFATASLVAAQPSNCNAASPTPSAAIALPTSPFGVAPTEDGCWLFVALRDGVAALRRDSGRVALVNTVRLGSPGTGLALTHDGKLLAVAAQQSVDFLDVDRVISGGKALAGSISFGRAAGSIYANVTADDKLLFVSLEGQHAIAAIDLAKARAHGYGAAAIIGRIPVGNAPIALTFSPDGKWLYTTSEGALDDWHWPKACRPEGRGSDVPISRPEGAVVVIDVARAAADPAHSVVARVPAACSPVRMAISPAGDRIYVTARNSNAVQSFDTVRLVSDGAHARVGMVPVGSAPVPVAVIDGGRKLVVGNSDRFSGSKAPQTLTVVDAAKMQDGAAAVLGSIPAGAFPREMAVSSDGLTLFLTNFASQSLQWIDIPRLPLVR